MAKYIKLNFLKPQPITAPITADPRNIDIPVSWSPAASMEKSNVIVKTQIVGLQTKQQNQWKFSRLNKKKNSKNLDVCSQTYGRTSLTCDTK